jgi:hypothetical protein
MRQIESRYAGSCARCGAEYEPGTQIVYGKPTGCFCVGCEPVEPDEIRAYRQAKIDAKNERREGWARARERRGAVAQARSDTLMCRDASGRADWALVSEPGYSPQRAQANRAQERAWQEQIAADEHRARKLMPARVAGDAERARAERRDKVREAARDRIGSKVECPPYGVVTLLRVNTKSATVQTESGFRDRVCLTLLNLLWTEKT